ncbi:sensor histidine kinase [Burkholderia gladioli]|uniref:sensor histidine kinase n=1 Tax=Burkholderia gladioli TaxID=28095 RepID=UPI000F531FA9|nr:sensor histidine kinase [Burkholderia gladioli]
MTLADFIDANLADLVLNWSEYAQTLSPEGHPLPEPPLRQAGADILRAIAANMRSPQSAAQQHYKAQGSRDAEFDFNRLTRRHADGRVGQGFDINDVVAEFRALRAAVLRRWAEAAPAASAHALQDMTRFNEAVDQALAETVRAYTSRAERSRDLFVAMVSHDLRSPLNAITTGAYVFGRAAGMSESAQRLVGIVERGAARMMAMLDDLLVFTQSRLSDTLPLHLELTDLSVLIPEALDELHAAFQATEVDLQLSGPLAGTWDRRRVQQLLMNLLTNAARYGDGRIAVRTEGRDGQIILQVFNRGAAIPPELLPTLFDPLTRSRSPNREGRAAGVGLGLFICQSIVHAHGGEIDVASTEQGTTFTVTLPTQP